MRLEGRRLRKRRGDDGLGAVVTKERTACRPPRAVIARDGSAGLRKVPGNSTATRLVRGAMTWSGRNEHGDGVYRYTPP